MMAAVQRTIPVGSHQWAPWMGPLASVVLVVVIVLVFVGLAKWEERQ